jgi:hypothetical protein
MRQYLHVQEALARFAPFITIRLAEMLLHDATPLPVGATIIVLSTRYGLDAASRAALRHLRAGGHPVTVLLAGGSIDTSDAGSNPEEQGYGGSMFEETEKTVEESASADLTTMMLGDASTWSMLLREALAAPTRKERADGRAQGNAQLPLTIGRKVHRRAAVPR